MGSIRKNKSRIKTLKRKNLIKRTIRKKSNRRKRSTKKIKRTRKKQITRKRKKSVKKKSNQKGGERDILVLPDRCFLSFLKDEIDSPTMSADFPQTFLKFSYTERSLFGSWNMEHCRTCFCELIPTVDYVPGYIESSYNYKMLLGDPSASKLDYSVGEKSYAYNLENETDFLNPDYTTGPIAKYGPICRFCRTAVIINERLMYKLKDLAHKYSQKNLKAVALQQRDVAVAAAGGGGGGGGSPDEAVEVVEEFRAGGGSETDPTLAQLTTQLEDISDGLANNTYTFEQGNTLVYPYGGNTEGKKKRKFSIRCDTKMPKPAMAVDFKNPEKIMEGEIKLGHYLTMGLSTDEMPIEFGKYGIHLGKINPKTSELVPIQVLRFDNDELRESYSNNELGRDDLLSIKGVANFLTEKSEGYDLTEEDKLLKQRFLRKLNILEYCKNIEIIDERQARAGGGTKIGVTRPSSPERTSLVKEGVSGGAAGPPTVSVTRPSSEREGIDGDELTEKDKQSIQDIVDAGGNIATIANKLKENRGLNTRSQLSEELLKKANKLYLELSKQ